MNKEAGYTVTELMVAVFIFGLMISFLIPIFEEIKADAEEQTALLESTQLLTNQIEQLIPACAGKETGLMRASGQPAKTVYELKWRCTVLKDQIIKIHVEVQWRDKNQKVHNREITTHRYIVNKALPI